MEGYNNKKISTSISIDFHKWDYIKNIGINLSEWVNQRIQKELMSKQAQIEQLNKEIEERQNEIKKLTAEIQEEEQKRKEEISQLSPEELGELKATIEVLSNLGEQYFKGRYNRYRNSFKPNVTEDEFRKILLVIKSSDK